MFRGKFTLIFLFSAFLFASACAPENKLTKKLSAVTSCVLAQDQSASLMYRWKNRPIPLSFRSGQFSAAEISAAIEAADSWNNYFKSAYGFTVFDYGSVGSPRTSSVDLNSNSSQLCSYTAVNSSTGAFTSSIVIFKRSTWPSSLPANAVAVTSACKTTGSTQLPTADMAMMEVNYQNFYGSGQAAPDLESIFLHELGHLLGLDHSCASTGRNGHIACSSASLNPAYYEAVMYPSASATVTKQVLNGNDQGRASCLYGPTAF